MTQSASRETDTIHWKYLHLELFTLTWGTAEAGTMGDLLNQTPFKVNNENRRSEHALLLNLVTLSGD